MRQLSRAALVMGLLVFSASAAQASSITIDDLTDGPPGFSVTPDIDVTDVTQTNESLVLNFTFHIPLGHGVVCAVPGGCPQGFNLLEANGTVSDTLLLERIGSAFTSTDFQEFLRLTFRSDAEGSLSPLAGGRNILETGQFQPLGVATFLNSGSTFDIAVASDISEVPEPGSLILLGTGLVAVATRRRFKPRAQTFTFNGGAHDGGQR